MIKRFSNSSIRNGQRTTKLWDQVSFVGDFDSIATQTVSTPVTSITFSSIPQTYKHLQLRHIARNSGANTDLNIAARFNGDSSSIYSEHYFYGSGTAAAAGANVNTNAILFGRMTGANSTSGLFGISVNDILDYTNTNKFKTHRCFCGHDQTGSGFIFMFSGNWRSTSAITSITIYPGDFATTFAAGSSFALYGINA
jgi:hypothetical protein